MIPGVAAVYATGLLSSSSLIPQDLLHYFHVSLTKSFFCNIPSSASLWVSWSPKDQFFCNFPFSASDQRGNESLAWGGRETKTWGENCNEMSSNWTFLKSDEKTVVLFYFSNWSIFRWEAQMMITAKMTKWSLRFSATRSRRWIFKHINILC